MLTDIGKARVVLGMPSYGLVHPAAAQAHLTHWAANSRAVEVIARPRANGSFSARHFNEVWALALDLRDAGAADYFAMIHSDIDPEAWWIDTLLAELRVRGADLISCAVAMKDHDSRGRTSVAIGPENDPWAEKRYLSTEDLKRLPPTFGPEHVCKPGEVLLINTGLWLCDMRRPCWTMPDGSDFTFDNLCRIRKTKTRRLAEGQTEDYLMSYHLHASGARYLATTKVAVNHWGLDCWPNR